MPLYPKTGSPICGSCVYFCRHYIRCESDYFPLIPGHSLCLRTKDRKDDSACPS